MGIFNSIKKSRRASGDIDEKIEYLNKELEKTGIREAMTTSNMYVNGGREPNQQYSDFEATSINGYGLGLSGADGNGAGNAYVGQITADMRLGHAYPGMQGVAISPPHPVTGQRRYATTQTGFAGFFSPLRPGIVQRSGNTPSGGALWYYVPTHNNGGGQAPGLWFNLEFNTSNGKWSFWDTNFLGFFYLNQNLDALEHSGSNVGTVIKSQISSINFGTKGEIGTPQTLVLTKNNLDDPSFLPINIDGLSTQGFNYLKGKAGVDVSAAPYYSIDDKKNVINYYKKKQADPNYQPKPFERESLMRQMRAQGDGTQIASTDISTGFPPSPPDKEPVDPPPETPDEPPAPPEPSTDSDKKADPAGLDARAIRLGYNDPYYPVNPTGHYTAMVTTAQDILSAEMEAEFYGAAARGESPNYDTASINKAKQKLKQARADLDNWERWKKENNYIWKGSIDSSAEADKRKALLDKDKELDKEKQKLEDDKKKIEAEQERLAGETRKLIAKIGLAVAMELFGLGALKLTGKAVGKIPAIARFFKLSKAAQKAQIDDAVKAAKAAKTAEKTGKLSREVLNAADDAVDNLYDIFTKTNSKEAKRLHDTLYDAIDAGDSKTIEKIFQQIKKSKFKSQVPTPSTGSSVSGSGSGSGSNFNQPFGNPKSGLDPGARYDLLMQSYESKGKVLSEGAKLGHFEPEQLNVNIEDLRKGIMPEFPKDPPPEMVDGYSSKSRLAPKELEKSSFIKITKKDLAKNHRLKDSEIKDFMDTINAVNDFIKKHPEELVYAQTRYPKNDPRLAQLNWQMDQMLDAGKEYMDKHYPENQKLFKKVQKSIKKNIELTDPKSFKGVKVPKFEGVDLTDFKRRKEVVARHYKKTVKIKKLFSRKKT
jgi:hypothetical protein